MGLTRSALLRFIDGCGRESTPRRVQFQCLERVIKTFSIHFDIISMCCCRCVDQQDRNGRHRFSHRHIQSRQMGKLSLHQAELFRGTGRHTRTDTLSIPLDEFVEIRAQSLDGPAGLSWFMGRALSATVRISWWG